MHVTRRAFSIGTGIGFLASAAGAVAQPRGNSPAPNADAASVLTELREQFPIPALSAAVVRDGELAWAEAQGLADIELKVAAGPGSLFRIGSVSKVVTAAIGARLAQAGTIDLDAPISTYRPDLPQPHRATTLRQLYNHQGGVRHYGAKDFDFAAPGGPIDLRFFRGTDDALALFIDDPLVAEPGGAPSYSTFGYTLASAVLESAGGKDFVQLIADEVAAPLGLDELSPDYLFEPVAGRVGNYDVPQFYGRLGLPVPQVPVVKSVMSNPGYKWAGGGIVASARDLARFGAAHLSDGYLAPASRATLFTPRTAASPQMPALGLGWRLDAAEGFGRRFHHAGNMQGCRAQLALYPDKGLSVALLSNLGQTPGNILAYTDRIAAAFAA